MWTWDITKLPTTEKVEKVEGAGRRMESEEASWVWVFVGVRAQFPSGVFASRDAATRWIEKHRLSGVLTQYPLDVGVYDWAVQTGRFVPKRPDQAGSAFVGRFTTASMEHLHFEDGRHGDS